MIFNLFKKKTESKIIVEEPINKRPFVIKLCKKIHEGVFIYGGRPILGKQYLWNNIYIYLEYLNPYISNEYFLYLTVDNYFINLNKKEKELIREQIDLLEFNRISEGDMKEKEIEEECIKKIEEYLK